MSDFLKWLYQNFIRPQLEKAPQGEYAQSLSLLQNELDSPLQEALAALCEYTALQAFLLGLRVGQGLTAR